MSDRLWAAAEVVLGALARLGERRFAAVASALILVALAAFVCVAGLLFVLVVQLPAPVLIWLGIAAGVLFFWFAFYAAIRDMQQTYRDAGEGRRE